ncbi:unnamed protein product [Closterium sp. NIES-54]
MAFVCLLPHHLVGPWPCHSINPVTAGQLHLPYLPAPAAASAMKGVVGVVTVSMLPPLCLPPTADDTVRWGGGGRRGRRGKLAGLVAEAEWMLKPPYTPPSLRPVILPDLQRQQPPAYHASGCGGKAVGVAGVHVQHQTPPLSPLSPCAYSSSSNHATAEHLRSPPIVTAAPAAAPHVATQHLMPLLAAGARIC